MCKKKIYTKEGLRSVRCFLWTQVSCSNQGPWALCNLNVTYYCYITIYFVLTTSNDIKIVLFEVGVIRRSCNRKLKTFLFYSCSFYGRFKTEKMIDLLHHCCWNEMTDIWWQLKYIKIKLRQCIKGVYLRNQVCNIWLIIVFRYRKDWPMIQIE